MAAGEACAEWWTTGYPVRIVDRKGTTRHHPVWERFRFIRDDGAPLRNGPKCRPYIAEVTPERFLYRPYTPQAGWWRHHEPQQDFWIIEPHVKARASPNKHWSAIGWAEVASRAEVRLIQPLYGPPPLPGVEARKTASFLDMIPLMAAARGYIGVEGALHHLAGAMGKPAVVVRGAYISPKVTGYPNHVDLFTPHTGDNVDSCGRRAPCLACRKIMDAIEPGMVLDALKTITERDCPSTTQIRGCDGRAEGPRAPT